MNSPNLPTLWAVLLSLQVSSMGSPVRERAEEQNNIIPPREHLIFNETFESPEGNRPNTRWDRPRCNHCSGDTDAFVPIVPSRAYGLTFEKRPSIFFKLPETTARSLLLVFENQTEGFREEAILPIAQTSGIVSFALPDRFPPLEMGQTYEWKVAFICGEEISVNDPFFNGYVTRITRSPEVERELERKTEIARSQWYAERGYWYDLVSTMARARQESPDDRTLTRLWESLLTSVGLEEIATQPLLGID